MEKNNRFYTIKEATDMLGISEQEVMNMISQKKLPAIRMEKSIRIREEDLEEDINYLQYQYDEFKNKIKNLVSDEFKMFLKKIDEVNPVEGNEVLQNSFENNLDVDEDEDIDKTAENQKDGS